VTSGNTQVAANLVQPGWLLRVVSEDFIPVEEWLEVFLVLHTQRGGGLPKRVWIYLHDRAHPLIREWDDVVEVRQSVVK
jgi:hypothetical protein